MDEIEIKVHSNNTTLNIKTICSEIDAGKNNNGGIRLRPFYQREYKFNRKDESFLIESLLIGIPIPTIYLASDTSVFPHISNVIDGQHRLRAIHRFINNNYKLTSLERLKSLNGKNFDQLSSELKNKLFIQTSISINYIHVQDDPSLELEIFLRYNKGTNPMSKQEIRHVLFGSEFNDWVIKKVDTMRGDSDLKDIFNISKNRYANKIVHSDVFTMFNIFHYGLNKKNISSPNYVEEVMKVTKNMNNDEIKSFIEKSDFFYTNFMNFLKNLKKSGVVYPLSKEIYDSEYRRYHFQTSILMIVSVIFRHILKNNINFSMENINNVSAIINRKLNSSDFSKAKSATTKYDLLNSSANSVISEL